VGKRLGTVVDVPKPVNSPLKLIFAILRGRLCSVEKASARDVVEFAGNVNVLKGEIPCGVAKPHSFTTLELGV